MKSFRENPDSDEAQQASRQIDREVFELQQMAKMDSEDGLDRWSGGFIAGEQVTAHGTPWHGKTGTVVTEWKSHWYRRPGLVAVFLPDFPATKYWWFAPHNLKRPNSI